MTRSSFVSAALEGGKDAPSFRIVNAFLAPPLLLADFSGKFSTVVI